MSERKNKNLQVYMGVNKNGFVSLHLEEPIRDGNKWKSNKPFCNSLIQKQFDDLAKRAQMTWENECEIFELSVPI
jgi:hypothetical protein